MAEEEELDKEKSNDMTETYFKLSELKLKALEREYQETIKADNKLNEITDNQQLKGTFKEEKINNVQFINTEEKEKNEELPQQENQQENKNKDEYQQIQDAGEGEEDENNVFADDNWGEFQQNNDEAPQIKNQPEGPKLDAELIKSIMSKIDIKPPEWAQNPAIWEQKCKLMFGQKLN